MCIQTTVINDNQVTKMRYRFLSTVKNSQIPITLILRYLLALTMNKSELHNRINQLSRRGFLSSAVTTAVVFPNIRNRKSTTAPELVFSDTYSVSGLVNDVSASGQLALYGFDDGNAIVYSDDREGEYIPLQVDSSLSKIIIREDANSAILAWMDVGMFGKFDLTVDDGVLIEHTDLQDIDTTEDASQIASVSYPNVGSGSVSVVTDNGEIQWETLLTDAVGLAVAITNDGEHVAVAGGGVMANGEPDGGGVYFYDGDGDEVWTYETEADVFSISVDADDELVAAGTDFGETVVLNFDGEEMWQTTDFGGRTALSGDGGVLVADSIDNMHAVESETGKEKWRVETGFLPFDEPSVSAEGRRVLTSDRTGGEILLIENGDTVWEENYEGGPAVGSLSENGSTWSISIQNNETQTGRIEQYRDESL